MGPRNRGYTPAAQAHEEYVALRFRAKTTPGSGAGLHYKDDGGTGADRSAPVPLRFECKGTASKAFTLTLRMWVPLVTRAQKAGELPFLALRTHRGDSLRQQDWAIVSSDYLTIEELDRAIRCPVSRTSAGKSTRFYVEAQRIYWDDIITTVRIAGRPMVLNTSLDLICMPLELLGDFVDARRTAALSADTPRHEPHRR